MTCERVAVGGTVAIVCGVRGRKRRCPCGHLATLECDWKRPTKKSGTCDAPLCERCTYRPAPGKDLCPLHVEAFNQWKATRK